MAQINLSNVALISVTGEDALTGTNPKIIITGLKTVSGFTATLKGSIAPGLSTSVLTYNIPVSGDGTVQIFAWMPTGATNPTLIASTGTETFSWQAVGTH